jgi:nucleotide-binding universal stress UspA family protein
MYNHILIPTDGSALCGEAVTYGVRLAKAVGAKVSLLTATEPFHLFSLDVGQLEDTPDEYRRHTGERAARILASAAAIAAGERVVADTIHVKEDHPYRAIIAAAENKGCDLIVMASHGRRGISALVLGSETTKVLTHSSVPVLVYRSPTTTARHGRATAAAAPELV